MSHPRPIVVVPLKSGFVAYMLLILLGGTGLHRFYLGQWIRGFMVLGYSVACLLNPEMWPTVWLVLAAELAMLWWAVRRANRKLLAMSEEQWAQRHPVQDPYVPNVIRQRVWS